MANGKLRISIGLTLHAASPENLREYMIKGIDFNKAAGFDALDFNMALIPKFAPDTYPELLAEMKEYAISQGIRFELTHLPFGVTPSSSAESLENFSKNVYMCIDAAAILGVDYAVMHPIATSVVTYAASPEDEYEADVRFLAPFVEYANKKGVNIVVENMRLAVENYKKMAGYMPLRRNCHTPKELARVADTLGTGVCWDFGHAHICGLKQSESLEYLGSRVKMLHVCDNFGYDDEHLPPYFGNINWEDAALGLTKAGYKGLFNFEVGAGKLPFDARENYAQYLIKVAEKITGMVDVQ